MEKARRLTTRTVFLSDSALLLEAPGSGNPPAPRFARHRRPSLGIPCEPTRSLSPTLGNVRPRRRIKWPTRARPRSPLRRGSAHMNESTSTPAATQSGFSRNGAEPAREGRRPQRAPRREPRAPFACPRCVPHGATSAPAHVHANRDLATLPRPDRDRSTGPRHLPRAGPFDGDPEA